MAPEKALGHAAILLPVAHLTVCFIYMFGYTVGFGANVGSFFSVSDIFSTAIADVSYIYFTGAILPAIFIHYMEETKSIPLIGTVDFKTNPTGFDNTAQRVERWIRPIGGAVFFAILFFEIIAVVESLFLDTRFPYGIIQTVLILVYFAFIFDRLDRFRLTPLQSGYVWLALSLPIAALSSGLSAGQADRREPYVYLAQKSAICGGLAIRRKAGNFMIGVDKSERRLLVTEDCRPRATFPKRNRFLTANEEIRLMEKRRAAFWSFLQNAQ